MKTEMKSEAAVDLRDASWTDGYFASGDCPHPAGSDLAEAWERGRTASLADEHYGDFADFDADMD